MRILLEGSFGVPIMIGVAPGERAAVLATQESAKLYSENFGQTQKNLGKKEVIRIRKERSASW
jgi:hypothetical protein